ncbi:MAG: sigma-54-dependent transcriptional regulator [Calditrichia bacterium]
MKRILVVDDDNALRIVICKTLTSTGYEVESASNGDEALEILTTKCFDLMITDLSMPGMSGIELIEKCRELYPNLGCLMITAYASVDKAVAAMKLGTVDFITKPFSLKQLEEHLDHFFEVHQLQVENKQSPASVEDKDHKGELLGNSTAISKTLALVDIVAQTEATVLILGESGTGKELIAREIHARSPRANKPFLKVNCAAIPETLFESTLFGHEKGSFSGAIKDVNGIFEDSCGGTLLLDEISEISTSMQAKLLRVLQEKVIQKVGTSSETPVDVRIIATSNRNMSTMVKEQKFREDLFFRLNVFPVLLPPLREREDDIILLANHFLKFYAGKYSATATSFSQDALVFLSSQKWPGNVRELENLIERSILLNRLEPVIDAAALNFSDSGSATELLNPAMTFNLEAIEKKLIFEALEETNNHRSKAAELLGISIRTLRNKLNIYRSEEETESIDVI